MRAPAPAFGGSSSVRKGISVSSTSTSGAACGPARPWRGAASWRGARRSCRSRGPVRSSAASPTCRWNASPSGRRPRTRRERNVVVHHRAAVTELLPQVAQAKVRTRRQASRQARAAAAGTAEPASSALPRDARRTPHRPGTLLEPPQRTRKAGHERTLRGYMFIIRSYHAAGPKTTTRCAAGLKWMSLLTRC